MPEGLVLLFPHREIVDFEEEAVLRMVSKRFTAKRAEYLLARPTRVMRTLRRRVQSVYLVVHQEKTGQVSNISPRFGTKLGDKLIVSGVIVSNEGRKWINSYPDWPKLIQQIPEETVIIGGFHYEDCVQKFTRAAWRAGKTVMLSPLLTDLYYLYDAREVVHGMKLPFPLPIFTDAREFIRARKQHARRLRRILLH